jgi:hypothetical protein
MHCICRPLDFITQKLFGEEKCHEAPYYAISYTSCYCLIFGPMCLRLQPDVQHPQPMFLPECDRSTIAPIQNRQQYTAVRIIIFTVLGSKQRQKIVGQLETGIP